MTTEQRAFQIRPACLADASELARLCCELGYPATHAEILTRLQAAPHFPHLYIAVAAHGATLLGWIAAEHRLSVEVGEIVEISGLVVDASQRGAGIGRALLTEAEQWGKKCRVSTVWVSSAIARTGSHAFYEHAGFVRSKTQHRYCKTLA